VLLFSSQFVIAKQTVEKFHDHLQYELNTTVKFEKFPRAHWHGRFSVIDILEMLVDARTGFFSKIQPNF